MFRAIARYAFITIFSSAIALYGADAWCAEPTVHDIYEAAKNGQMSSANSMIDEVLRVHPNSAKAHFVKAELQSRQGQLAAARDELMNAKRLQPDLTFADANSLKLLEQRLSPRALSSSNLQLQGAAPWGIIFFGFAVLIFGLFVVRRLMSQRQTYQMPPSPYPNATTGYAGQPYGAPSGGLGGSVLGGLATGAAIGAGMVAGEALAHNLMGDSRRSDAFVDNQSDESLVNQDMGGEDFGVSDSGSWDDSSSDFSDIGGGDWS